MDTINQKAEGKRFNFLPESAINSSELVTFKFDSPKQYIETIYPEFSAVCPFSGLPDIATLTIEYYPEKGKALELKALKYYLLSFRNVGIYQEGVTKRIFNDLKKLIGENLKVTTVYNVRGGFETTCIEGEINYKI
jgi:7-cyano-7-deazaguanine reductase